MNKPETIKFEECPQCGCKDRIANNVLKKEKEKGKVRDTLFTFLYNHKSLVMDTAKIALSHPVIISYFDACSDCGCVYMIRCDIAEVMPQAQMPDKSNLKDMGPFKEN
jgi:uncharacterized Zn finger protein